MGKAIDDLLSLIERITNVIAVLQERVDQLELKIMLLEKVVNAKENRDEQNRKMQT